MYFLNTEETTYKQNTLLKQKVFTKIDNPSSPDTEYDFDYGYDLRGNIITSILTQKYNGNTNYSSISAYSWDKANRLSSEYNDALSNIIAILDEDKEVAHYEYDAWGN